MYSQVDHDLRARGTHLYDATSDPAAVTSDTALQPAVARLRDRSGSALVVHEAATKAVEDDRDENRAVALAFTDAITEAGDQYAVLRVSAATQLLNLTARQRAELGSIEAQARRDFYARAFAPTWSDLAGLGRTNAMTRLKAARSEIQGSPYGKLLSTADLFAAIAEVEQTHAAVVRESLDDAPLYDALVVARARLLDHVVGFRSVLEGFLRADGATLDVDAFLLAAKPTPAAAPAPPVAEAPAPTPELEPEPVG